MMSFQLFDSEITYMFIAPTKASQLSFIHYIENHNSYIFRSKGDKH